jgi:hypothetical protein
MIRNIMLITGLLMASQTQVFANDTIDKILESYKQQGTSEFSIDAGKKLWTKEITHSESPPTRSCASCHGSVLSTAGKHVKTGKVIKAMSPMTNPQRFTDEAKIEKWFYRNCKWTWGRECNVQEKGDILLFLSTQ